MPKTKIKYRLILLFFACFYALGLEGQNYYQDYWDGHLFVKFKNSLNISSLSAIKNLPAKSLESRLIDLANEFNFIHFAPASSLPDPVLQTYYKLVFTQPEKTQDLIRALSLLPEVELVEQEPLYKPIHTPNDYRALRANPPNIVHWHLDIIKAQEAWDISRGSKDVVIAIIDDAVLTTHEDLRDNIWINPKEIPNNGIDDDRNGYIDDINGWDFIDKDNNPNPPSNRNDFSHGAHVAGIASAVTNNGRGVASIGYNCKIMALKSASDTARQIRMQNWSEALEYAIRNKANVVNMSFGGSGYSSFFEKLIERATAAGVTVVAAAGNDGVNRIFYPAGYKTAISVGATDWNDAKADFSNYGSWVSVFAPGIVVSTVTSRTQPYDIQGGTSMASPLVAGLCGLLLSYNPRLTPAQIKNCLVSTAVNIESKNPVHLRGLLGAGRIDAVSALRCTDPPVCNPDTIRTHYVGKPEILQNEWGYPAGTNARRYKGIAQAFTEQKGVNRLLGFGMELGKIMALDKTNTLKCVVRSVDTRAAPGEIIQSFDIPLTSILEHYAKSNDIFYFLFPEPITTPYAYYLGLEYNFANQDTIVLKTTLLQGQEKSTVWVKSSNDQWTTFSAAWGKAIGLGVFPISRIPKD
jgi:subtilisin family serine protease